MQSNDLFGDLGPSTALTFMLTDIEGSTRLWERHPDAMAKSLIRHDELVATHTTAHSGELIGSRAEGDSTFAVFQTAPDAIECASELQRALTAEPWPQEIPLRVRIALHTGQVRPVPGGHYGPVVNRCARIRAAAHGGQVLLSEATVGLVSRPPAGVSFVDLGLHRLRDLSVPERVYQLSHPRLESRFPPLQTLDSAAHNLPDQLTTFVGRDREMAEIYRLLDRGRLLTLVGSGGCGKTRLALQVAAPLADQYKHGVWLVELGALIDPNLVPGAAISALGLREEPGRPPVEILIAHLRSRSLLMVLDNCEHLLQKCRDLAVRLLMACRQLRMLATSREALGVPGETVFRVPSLTVPSESNAAALSQPEACQAVQLFVERAQAVDPDSFRGSAEAHAVNRICRLLDGIPLAIELAAARTNVLTPAEIARRLDDRFSLLVRGNRSAPPRQQTLRATMDWSHELLAEQERVLFRRLATFVGGWSLEAAEAVCGIDRIRPGDVLELLSGLVSKSLVVTDRSAGETRYRMLETIRQYALTRLAEAYEAASLKARHRDHFLALAERAEQELFRAQQVDWNRLTAELDNLRAALEWSLAETDGGEAALRLTGALGEFWDMHGDYSEGSRWLALALAKAADASPGSRARALIAAGLLTSRRGEYSAARRLYEEGLTLARRADLDQVTTLVLGNLGLLAFR
jgi:predicted ATPase/class 3 adenylate cyclase